MPHQSGVHTPTAPVHPSPVSTYRSINCMRLVGAVLSALLGLAVVPGWALDTAGNRATLRGLLGVRVVVEDIKPEIERAGLTKSQLQTDVELRLRQSGIRVLTKGEVVPGQPYLYVLVHALLEPGGLSVYYTEVVLCQNAYLETGKIVYGVTTWDVSSLGTVRRTRLSQLRKLVRDKVDMFISAYLSVNPRPAGSPLPAQAAPPPAPQPARRTR